MFNKRQITERLLRDLEHTVSVDQAMQVWWQDFRDEGGMRLTSAGYDAFEQAWDLEKYTFEALPSVLVPRRLLILNRKLECPYYIKVGKKYQLVLYDDRQAMMMALYGDFAKFLDYLERT